MANILRRPSLAIRLGALALALWLALAPGRATPAGAATITISDQASCGSAGGAWDAGSNLCSFVIPYTVAAGDVLEMRVQHVEFASLTNNGAININFGGRTTVGAFVNNGSINITTNGLLRLFGMSENNGAINVNSGGVLEIFPDRAVLTNKSTININAGGTLDNVGAVVNEGTITRACGGTITGNPILGNPAQEPADCTPPEVTLSSDAPEPTNISPIPVTAQFNEPVSGFSAEDITPGNATVGNFSAVDGDTYTFELTPLGQGIVTADIAAGVAQDAAGNPNTAAAQFSRTFDSVAPAVTINQAAGQADPTSASPINFTAVFNEPVSGFGDSSGEVTLGGSAGATTAAVTEIAPNDGTTYNVAVSGMTGSGEVSASIPANAATDAAGNGNPASTSSDNTVTFILPPCDTLLDDFNRSGPRLGSSWTGATSLLNYKLDNQQVKVLLGGPLIWKNPAFGTTQEACVTLTKINPKGLHKLLLKVKERNWIRGSIFVFYDAREGKVGVKTYRPGHNWSFLATFPLTLRDGDQLAGQALADGTVRIFVNGSFVGQANAGSFFADKGGYIGLWFVNLGSPPAILDDFKGK